MGASTFAYFEVKRGDQDTLQTAFGRAVDAEQYEHGHGGYSGTLAEKHSVKLATTKTFAGYKDAYEYAEGLMNDANHWCQDKWGPAAAVRVIGTMQRYEGDTTPADGWLFFGWASM